ncbi:MAG TPA: RNA polymerase sigma factor [Rhizomicrobium sp.]|nr:RNA polymerase sigma factor [Rhizomicrobium sp.]
MVETPETSREDANLRMAGMSLAAPEVRAWFAREVLPLETILIQFLRRNWRDQSEIEDLLQEVYARVFEAARREIPETPKPFVFTTARNLLINRVRQQQIVAIESVADLETLGLAMDEPGPDRNAIARDELRRLQSALDRLPPRCRQAIVLKRIEGLSRREIAQRMGIGEGTVKDYLAEAVSALSDMLYRESSDLRRQP